MNSGDNKKVKSSPYINFIRDSKNIIIEYKILI